MTPPDWGELGRHNREWLRKWKSDKAAVERRKRERKEAVLLALTSLLLILLGLWVYSLC